jgi:hypothetical protein
MGENLFERPKIEIDFMPSYLCLDADIGGALW